MKFARVKHVKKVRWKCTASPRAEAAEATAAVGAEGNDHSDLDLESDLDSTRFDSIIRSARAVETALAFPHEQFTVDLFGSVESLSISIARPWRPYRFAHYGLETLHSCRHLTLRGAGISSGQTLKIDLDSFHKLQLPPQLLSLQLWNVGAIDCRALPPTLTALLVENLDPYPVRLQLRHLIRLTELSLPTCSTLLPEFPDSGCLTRLHVERRIWPITLAKAEFPRSLRSLSLMAQFELPDGIAITSGFLPDGLEELHIGRKLNSIASDGLPATLRTLSFSPEATIPYSLVGMLPAGLTHLELPYDLPQQGDVLSSLSCLRRLRAPAEDHHLLPWSLPLLQYLLEHGLEELVVSVNFVEAVRTWLQQLRLSHTSLRLQQACDRMQLRVWARHDESWEERLRPLTSI